MISRKLIWDFVTVAAIGGIVWGGFQYYEFAGPWKSLVMIPLMLALGWLMIATLYPLWFSDK